jgi:tRNA pseudouridine55 synthase
MKEGIYAVWKPKGISSHDMVNRVRRAAGTRAVGHAGTLDPLAEGVLVVGVGRAALRSLGEIVQKEKEYVGTVRLGRTSATDDEEGEKTICPATHEPNRAAVEAAARSFVGAIEQVPPAYSALKIRGKPAYAYARAGAKVPMKPRVVEIKEIEVLSYAWPDVVMRAVTGPGAYIRALARDMGAKLGTGGYLAALTRTRVGNFTKETCIAIE